MIKTLYIAVVAAAIGAMAAPGQPCVPYENFGKLQLVWQDSNDTAAISAKHGGKLSKVGKTSQKWQFYQCNDEKESYGRIGEVRSGDDFRMCLTAKPTKVFNGYVSGANFTLERCILNAGKPDKHQRFAISKKGRLQATGERKGTYYDTFFEQEDNVVVGVEPYKGEYNDAYLYIQQ